MSSLLPWLAVAGAGALHGLNPATGWMFAAAWRAQPQNRVQSRGPAQALAALVPIAVGHAVSVALVAATVAFGLAMDRTALQLLAGGLLIGVAALRFLGRRGGAARPRACMPAGHAGLALWSFIMSTVHGAGMMLVPALVPLCIANSPAREITASGSLGLALAAVGVHAAAMLAVTGVMAVMAGRAAHAGTCWLQRFRRNAVAGSR